MTGMLTHADARGRRSHAVRQRNFGASVGIVPRADEADTTIGLYGAPKEDRGASGEVASCVSFVSTEPFWRRYRGVGADTIEQPLRQPASATSAGRGSEPFAARRNTPPWARSAGPASEASGAIQPRATVCMLAPRWRSGLRSAQGWVSLTASCLPA